MAKAILVETKGKKIKGTVADENDIEKISKKEIDTKIQEGVDTIKTILTKGVEDPTMKKCTRCIKMGRLPFHPIEDFSKLKNGKLHSQCKVCRVEQSNEWCEKQKEHRREYHREYYKRRPPVDKTKVKPAPAPVIEEVVEAKAKVADALFVGYTKENVQETA